MNIESVPYFIFEDDFNESRLYSLYDDDGLEELEKMIKLNETKDKAKWLNLMKLKTKKKTKYTKFQTSKAKYNY